jgi:Nucleotidyltransferase domain
MAHHVTLAVRKMRPERCNVRVRQRESARDGSDKHMVLARVCPCIIGTGGSSGVVSQRLVDEKMAEARDIVNRYVDDENVEAVYLSGSLMAGLGTPYSDVDIFVVSSDRSGTFQHGSGASRVDVEFRSSEWLEQVSSLARPFAATVDDNYTLRTTPDLIEDAVRLEIGTDLKKSPELSATRNALQAGRRDLQKLLISQLAADLGAHWMDALGFLANGDHDSAEILSGEILVTALDAACVPDGDLYRGTKWVWNRVQRNKNLAPAHHWIRGLLLTRSSTGLPGSRICMQRMLAAQKLLSLALLREWNPVRHPPTPAAAPQGDGELVRSPYWVAVRLSNSAVITDRGIRSFTLPDLALACWAAADGLSREELEENMAVTYPDSIRQISKTIDALIGMGAITAVGTWRKLFLAENGNQLDGKGGENG